MKIAPVKKLREMVKLDNSKGHPDSDRLDKARAFARTTMDVVMERGSLGSKSLALAT